MQKQTKKIKKLNVNSLRKFLKDNDVFFNTISAILLSIMALIVSYQVKLIAERQLLIDYNEKEPDFYFENIIELDSIVRYESSKTIKKDTIIKRKTISYRKVPRVKGMKIFKYGGIAKNIEFERVTVLDFHLRFTEIKKRGKNDYFGINREKYKRFFIEFDIDEFKKRISENNHIFDIQYDNKYLKRRYYPFIDSIKKIFKGNINVDLRRYGKISYIDVLGVKKEIFLFLNSSKNQKAIPTILYDPKYYLLFDEDYRKKFDSINRRNFKYYEGDIEKTLDSLKKKSLDDMNYFK